MPPESSSGSKTRIFYPDLPSPEAFRYDLFVPLLRHHFLKSEKAGMEKGDIIIGFGEKAINTVDELVIEVQKRKIGENVKLLVLRRGREHYFEVALGDKEETVKTITLGMGEGIAGWVAKNGRH
jgi:PDZ domain-containing secreted protein